MKGLRFKGLGLKGLRFKGLGLKGVGFKGLKDFKMLSLPGGRGVVGNMGMNTYIYVYI